MQTTAADFAMFRHEGQFRKYTGEKYIQHPLAVEALVKEFYLRAGEVDQCIFDAAVLHDTVEDTNTTHEELINVFGKTTARYVWYLTKVEEWVGNRATRKGLDAARLALAPEGVRIIKVFDLYHNSLSIREHDPDFYKLFRTETIELLRKMKVYDLRVNGLPLHEELTDWLNDL